ncbi:phosphoribosylanthranilate isomerase [Geoalkalibacter ferrihydriticus]|uniref:N-(5'-phosphoribosyl)anthranilate isomerase n=2 Tax=Geoalkalibacter ferrihydriticus TaxID=392333 RepID=A0A0C2HJ91_9BACT|nr:phosphoribosylanthranilate isomerase [Geoalkalibacter ferrihydriticus]KIH77111.1 N-(5'-phosphoribosyl)anthranilate isomerase [Geoalkalibacter ferrihydriticus DSM 17813]SDL33889.1 phosphoribosylanthranilate isomerase [Geoalkalibacter ferrihydriticus]
MRGVRVKICGITTLSDARHAVACGADALGFVFYAGSPRCVTPEQVRPIVSALPPFVSATGLFVNESRKRILAIADFCRLDVLQLHGDEAPMDCRFDGRRVIKALRVRDESSLAHAADYPVAALLLDAWVAGHYGGTGETFNWELAATQARLQPVILAGGLTPENVAAAVEAVQPFAVDVSSGVESAPGHKDPHRVAAFIRNAKAVGLG